MELIYRPITTWPGERTRSPKPHPFAHTTTWSDTLDLLDRELRMLKVQEAVLQVDSPSERDFTLAGRLRADARLRSGAVILSFEHQGQPVTIPCDAFYVQYAGERMQDWQVNVRAIALGLEALRKLERYGIANTGQQYRGWKQLGAGMAMGAGGGEQMSAGQAARFMAEHAVVILDGGEERPWGPNHKGSAVLQHDREEAKRAYRMAARRLHPDVPVTGSKDAFQKLEEARRVLGLDATTV